MSQPPDNPSRNGQSRAERPDPNLSPIIPGRAGRPSYSLDALRERVETQFQEETANRPDILLDLDTEQKRRDLLEEIADYVLAVEAITLSAANRSALITSAYRSLFTFGPLDKVVSDDRVTEIAINGPHSIHARRGMGRPEPVQAAFEDRAHLRRTLERVLASAGAVLPDDNPFLEVGVVMMGRAARLSEVGPPISPDYSLEIRLHPAQPITLDALCSRFGALPTQAVELLRAVLDAGHGLLIVGDVGLGKTTLAGALAHLLPPDAHCIAVERAPEMHLPPHVARRFPIPPTPGDPGQDFVSAIQAAQDVAPDWLILDEIRGDESAAVWDALTREQPPRYMWVFRGDPQPDRLRSALSMVIRQQHPAVEQTAIHRALAGRLPFVAAFRITPDGPRLHLFAEWAADDDGAALTLEPLLASQAGGWTFTGQRPRHTLDLPDSFWTQTP
jgi:pilus assembly protein CpaF